MLLKDISQHDILLETNIANAGKDEIVIYDADSNEVDVIHPFPKILKKFIESVLNIRTPANVRTWFERNFTKWLKNGAPDVGDHLGSMNQQRIQNVFYVSLDDYVNTLLSDEPQLVQQGKLSWEIIMKSFPDYVRNNPKDVTIFSGGRLFRLKRILPMIEKLHDYMVAISRNAEERNDEIMPPDFMVKRLDTLQVPEALKRSNAWHRWIEINQEKVNYNMAVGMVAEWKPGVDYQVIEKISDKISVIQLLSAKAADDEGRIMKHCVASYGHDIKTGKTIIYSFRDRNNVPVATAELSNDLKKAKQVTGPYNSTIKPEFHDAIRSWFKKHKINVASYDTKNFGGMNPQNKSNA